ncbi:helix-turn-helix domain-containing protein [Pseudonocardia spinosispora]|uniref:helix-turn-helix domain-containing protein n=1 Tax=Pseudonocardia spinosispora TaxID=103441 RepID=UPI0004111E2A
MSVADLLRAGHSVRVIACQLERSPATISREIKRNRDCESEIYHPHRAEQRAVLRRARSTEGMLRRNPELRQFVQQRLDQCWSPEQISVALRRQFTGQPDMQAASGTIYQALYRPERAAACTATPPRDYVLGVDTDGGAVASTNAQGGSQCPGQASVPRSRRRPSQHDDNQERCACDGSGCSPVGGDTIESPTENCRLMTGVFDALRIFTGLVWLSNAIAKII